MTIKDEIISEVHKLDPKLEETDPVFQAACVLLMVAQSTQNQKTIAQVFGISHERLSLWFSNWKSNGVIRGRKIFNSGWYDKDSGGIAFWMDVMCGLGFLRRT